MRILNYLVFCKELINLIYAPTVYIKNIYINSGFAVKTKNNILHHLFMNIVLNCQEIIIINPYTLYIGKIRSYIGEIKTADYPAYFEPYLSVIYSNPRMLRTTSISSPHLGHLTL